MVFDVTKRDTFDNLHEWIYEINAELHRRGSHQSNQDYNLPIILICGNKIDLVDGKGNDKNTHDSVEEIEARLWADVHGFQYYETSANTGEGVSDMFSTFFSTIVRQQLTHGGKLPKTPASARYKHDIVILRKQTSYKNTITFFSIFKPNFLIYEF